MHLSPVSRPPVRVQVADGRHPPAIHLLVAVHVHREAPAATCARTQLPTWSALLRTSTECLRDAEAL